MWHPTNWATPGYSISVIIPRRRGKSKNFLSVVIPVVKAAFVLLSEIGESPANAGVARLCGVSPHPIPDTATALPKQLRCTRRRIPPRQLRCIRTGAFLLYHNAGKMQVGMARKMRALGNLRINRQRRSVGLLTQLFGLKIMETSESIGSDARRVFCPG